ncbi:hypothetical protein SAMN05216327_11834 [Dyadobacter sp. SG02]|nr:hypothetical protein SAMN05216327_11834 [Dyadobacter sp. SG02]
MSEMITKCNEIDRKIELDSQAGIDRETSLKNLTKNEANAYTLFRMYSEEY